MASSVSSVVVLTSSVTTVLVLASTEAAAAEASSASTASSLLGCLEAIVALFRRFVVVATELARTVIAIVESRASSVVALEW